MKLCSQPVSSAPPQNKCPKPAVSRVGEASDSACKTDEEIPTLDKYKLPLPFKYLHLHATATSGVLRPYCTCGSVEAHEKMARDSYTPCLVVDVEYMPNKSASISAAATAFTTPSTIDREDQSFLKGMNPSCSGALKNWILSNTYIFHYLSCPLTPVHRVDPYTISLIYQRS